MNDNAQGDYMNDTDLDTAASALAEAERTRVPIGPLTTSYPDLDVDGAYAIQLRNVRRRVAASEAIRGHKVGLTAPSMRELFGVDEPDYGHLLASMFVADGAELPLDRFIDAQVEVEPAFILGRDLKGPGVTAEDVIAATAAVVASLEIIDSRIEDWTIKLQDTVADNGSSAAVVLGSDPIPLDASALDDASVELAFDGTTIERGSTREILGHPLTAVAWLANALARYDIALEAGHVVLPGTCTRSRRIKLGLVTGTIAGLGTVTVRVI
jgi:2-keto-4-pentenoate hydratase